MAKTKYYFYEFTANGFIKKAEFADYDALILFLAREQNGEKRYYDNKLGWANPYLDYVNLTMNDCYFVEERIGVEKKYIRPYVFFDEDYKIIDVREFYDDIIDIYYLILEKGFTYVKNLHKVKKDGFVYRQTPVPHTAKNRGGSHCRDVKLGRIIRDFKNPEMKKFIRKKRYYDLLEPYFDYPFKPRTKSWKSQIKSTHQWGKRMK